MVYLNSSRPLHGVLIFQWRLANALQNLDVPVLVTSTGFLYFNIPVVLVIVNFDKFSSHPRGSLISINYSGGKMKVNYMFSYPPRGSLISIMLLVNLGIENCSFSSPPRGSLISILSLTPPKTQGFHPPFAGQTRK